MAIPGKFPPFVFDILNPSNQSREETALKRIIDFLFPSIARRKKADAQIKRHQERLNQYRNSRSSWDEEEEDIRYFKWDEKLAA